jgi:hypothetical protein
MKSRYMVVEATDLRTRTKTFKVYERNSSKSPLVVGLATREEAEAKLRELEEAETK